MVKLEDIDTVITELLKNNKNLTVKCGPTIAEMTATLSEISYDEQYAQLKEKGYLNPLEEKDMLRTIEELADQKERREQFGGQDPLTDELRDKEIQRMEDELFQYGRRIIEGYETEFPVNLDDYRDKAGQGDEHIKMWGYDEYGDDEYTYEITHNMGYMEEDTITNQQNSINIKVNPNELVEDEWTGEETPKVIDERVVSMNNYFAGDLSHINYEISHKGYLDKINETARKDVENIDSLMEETDGLPYNTLLYRGGHFDIHTRVGETISFKGYQSTTFQLDVAKWYGGEEAKDRAEFGNMLYLIHAPKGTKGIAGNDERFDNGFMEHEYVLPRDTNMKVIRIDYENMICEVVIED